MFDPKMVLLIDQSSLHSLILKIREEALKSKEHISFDKEKVVFMNLRILDVFDEIDALMTPKKSFIYSVGNSSRLDQESLRYETYELLLEIFCDYFEKGEKSGTITFNDSKLTAKN